MRDALVQNAADAKQVKEARDQERYTKKEERDDLLFLLNSMSGRRYLWKLLEHCRVFASVFEPNSKIAYNSGMQDVGHYILAEIIEARPEAYLLMMKEAQERKQNG